MARKKKYQKNPKVQRKLQNTLDKKKKYKRKTRTSELDEEKEKEKKIDQKYYWSRAITGIVAGILGVYPFHLIGWSMFAYMMIFMLAFPFVISFVILKIPYVKGKWDWKNILKRGLSPYFFLFLLFSTVLHTIYVLPDYQDRLYNPADTYDLSVDGDILYIADGTNGLLIINTTTMVHRELLAKYQMDSPATLITANEKTAIVATQDNKINRFNIEKPNEPILIETIQMNSSIKELISIENYTIIATENSGIYLLKQTTEKTSQDMIIIEDIIPNFKDIQDITYDNGKLYIIDKNQGIALIDIQDPSEPSLIINLTTSKTPLKCSIVKNNLFILNEQPEISIIDFSTTQNPIINDNYYAINGTSTDILAIEDFLFIAKSEDGVYLINTTKIDNPTPIAQYNTLGNAINLELKNDTLIIADGSRGLDYTNIYQPRDSPIPANTKTNTISFGWNWIIVSLATIITIFTINKKKKILIKKKI